MTNEEWMKKYGLNFEQIIAINAIPNQVLFSIKIVNDWLKQEYKE